MNATSLHPPERSAVSAELIRRPFQELELDRRQIGMVKSAISGGSFGIDGWCSVAGKEAAEALYNAGWTTSEVRKSDQYTIIVFRLTAEAIAAWKRRAPDDTDGGIG